jgi:hypothetical protein
MHTLAHTTHTTHTTRTTHHTPHTTHHTRTHHTRTHLHLSYTPTPCRRRSVPCVGAPSCGLFDPSRPRLRETPHPRPTPPRTRGGSVVSCLALPYSFSFSPSPFLVFSFSLFFRLPLRPSSIPQPALYDMYDMISIWHTHTVPIRHVCMNDICRIQTFDEFRTSACLPLCQRHVPTVAAMPATCTYSSTCSLVDVSTAIVATGAL